MQERSHVWNPVIIQNVNRDHDNFSWDLFHIFVFATFLFTQI